MTSPVSTSVDAHGVLLIHMHQLSNLNAMSPDMVSGLVEAFARAECDDVRAVVITGEGRAFSAGGDVKSQKEGLKTANAAFRRLSRSHALLTKPLVEMTKPVVAAVNGVAAGAGLAMALASDLRVVSERARFVLAFNAVGLVPDFATGYLLPRLIGLSKAKEILLLHKELNAPEALSLGLATLVVPPDEVLDTAIGLARSIAAGPTVSIGLTKRLLQDGLDMTLTEFLAREAAYQAIASQTDDHQVARAAFLAKTVPAFTGR